MLSPFSVIADALQAIPPKVRKIILLVYACAVVLVQILALIEVDLDYLKVNGVLAILGGYLGFQSAANVSTAGAHRADAPVDQPPVVPPIEGDHGAA